MSAVKDRPGIELEDLLGNQPDDVLGAPGDFPNALIMISLGGGKYAANNATTPGPDPMDVNILVVFTTEEEAEKWEAKWKLTGEHVSKNFEEARAIALSKSNVFGLGLQINANTAIIHWVR